MYKAIGEGIYNILNSLVATTTLTVVYNYDAKSSDSYPYAIVTTKDGSEDILDTMSNIMTYNFLIRVINVNKDIASMEPVMRQLCDNILAELRKATNQTLGGTVDSFIPKQVSWGWAEGTEPLRIFEISIEVKKIFNIS